MCVGYTGTCIYIDSPLYLLFDLLLGVGEEDGAGGVRGAHLGLGALQGWEEGGVQQRWLVEAQPGGHVTSHAEIGVLK